MEERTKGRISRKEKRKKIIQRNKDGEEEKRSRNKK